MNQPSPSYPGQIWLSVSPLEASALRYAIRVIMSLRILGAPSFSYRQDRDALRRIQRKLKRAAAADPS